MQEKKQKKIKAPGAPAKLAGYGMYPKRDGENFAGGRSRPSLDGRKEAKEDQGVRDAGHLWPGTSMYPKRDGGRIASVMDLPILAGIGETGYVWIPIFFKGLRAFSCRQGRGVWHTPSERPHRGRMGLLG